MKENCGISRKAVLLLAWLFLLFSSSMLAQNPGVIHISPEKGGDYCFLFPSLWMKSHQEGNKNHWLDLQPLTQNLTYAAMCCLPSFFGEDDNDGGGFSTRIASVREGNCNLFENARLRQINGTQGLLTLGGDAPYPKRSLRSTYYWGHCEEITIPGVLLSDADVLHLLFKNLISDLLYKTGIIYVMSMGIVIIGSYWAGRTEKKKQHIKSQYQIENSGEITIDTNVSFTCTYIVMATFVLFSFYYLHDYILHAMTGIYCLYASFSLYCCLAPFVNKFSFGRSVIHFPYIHKGLEIRALLLAMLCMSVSAAWIIFRNEEVWGWVLQDILGMSIGIYILRTVHMPNLKNCSLFLIVHLFYDAVCLLITPFFTKTGRSVTDVRTLVSHDSEKMPFLLKVPVLPSVSILDENSFTLVGLGDIVVPGFLVAYCHRFDVQVDSSGVYFLASTLAYSYGLLVTFVAATFLQACQPTLLHLVPCILITILTVAVSRKEVMVFWTGTGSEEDMSHPYLEKAIKYPIELKESKEQLCQQEGEKQILNITFQKEKLSSNIIFTEEVINSIPNHEELASQHEVYKKDEVGEGKELPTLRKTCHTWKQSVSTNQ